MMIVTLSILLIATVHTISAQTEVQECSVNVDNMTADDLILNTPQDWTFGCLNERLLNEALAKKDHVNAIVECLHPDVPICATKGYEVIADEVFRRIDGGGQCINCSKRTNKLVDYAVKLMQQQHPKELRTMLSYLG